MAVVGNPEGAVPCPSCSHPAVPSQPFVAPPSATLLNVAFPLESRVAREDGVCTVCDPPPVTIYVLVRFPAPTTVTVPLPEGEAHVPSPLQNVLEDALVPLLRLVTGRFPVTPVERGSPVAFVNVTLVGVPKIGVTSVGDVLKTNRVVPVSLVTAAARLALLGVARNVATPVPIPDTPVLIGNPVAFVRVPLDGVPRGPPL